jgi:quinohemoprotein ethanol dehydrogenase
MKNSSGVLLIILLLSCNNSKEKINKSRFEPGNVPYERILQSANDSINWLTYSGDYASCRYSRLSNINTGNVSKLSVAWVYQTTPGLVEASPIIVDGIMYITEPPSTVTALDARTGRKLWTWSPTMTANVKAIGFPPVNRGVAVLIIQSMLELDHTVVALDAKPVVKWNTTVGQQ